MNVQIVIDQTGDTRHTFDPSDYDSLQQAERRFRKLTGEGFRAVSLGRDGEPGSLVREFNPTAERTLFIPQLQGG